MVFGIDMPKTQIKPSPYSLYKIMETYNLKKDDLLVIDDLKPGLTMARAAGVAFCASAWCHNIPANATYMKQNADYFCQTVEELKILLK